MCIFHRLDTGPLIIPGTRILEPHKLEYVPSFPVLTWVLDLLALWSVKSLINILAELWWCAIKIEDRFIVQVYTVHLSWWGQKFIIIPWFLWALQSVLWNSSFCQVHHVPQSKRACCSCLVCSSAFFGHLERKCIFFGSPWHIIRHHQTKNMFCISLPVCRFPVVV